MINGRGSGLGLGKSFAFINALRLTPGKMAQDLNKKFKVIITGSMDMAPAFYEILTKDAHFNISSEKRDSKLTEFIEVIPAPIDDETRKDIKPDVLFYCLSSEDVNEEFLRNYREIYKLKPPAMLFIEEPDTPERRDEISRLLDHLFISGVEWIPGMTEDVIKSKAGIILDLNKKFDLSLAYRFPILRPEMAGKLTHGTGTQNMIIALASSLPTNIPIIGIIIGLLAVAGETTVLTINQIKLCLQIAGLYGYELSFIDRVKELWPLVGSALGFRTIARSLVGFIPIAGPTIKAAIAYGGTYLVGEAARWYYEKGRVLTAEEKKKLYEDAKNRALKMAKDYVDKFKTISREKEATEREDEDVEFDSIEQGLEELEKRIREVEGEEEPKETIPPWKKALEEPGDSATRIIEEMEAKEEKAKSAISSEVEAAEKKKETKEKKPPEKAKKDMEKEPQISAVKKAEEMKPIKMAEEPAKKKVEEEKPIKKTEKSAEIKEEKKEELTPKKEVSKKKAEKEPEKPEEEKKEEKAEAKEPEKPEEEKKEEKAEAKEPEKPEETKPSTDKGKKKHPPKLEIPFKKIKVGSKTKKEETKKEEVKPEKTEEKKKAPEKSEKKEKSSKKEDEKKSE